MSKARKLTLVEWDDSTGCAQPWMQPDEVPDKPVRIRSAGFVLKESGRSLTLVADRTVRGSKMVGRPITIPKGAIRKRRRLR